MRAGQLNSRVKIQKRGTGTDAWGQPDPDSWADHVEVWANIRHLSGAEAIKGDAVTSLVRASIRIRRRAGIDAGMRVVQGTTTYEIKAVMPDEVRREFTDLACEVVS